MSKRRESMSPDALGSQEPPSPAGRVLGFSEPESPTIVYRVGFESPSVTAFICDRNPGFVPVVRVGGSVFAFGEVVALAENSVMAQGFADWLNAVERAKGRA